MESRLDHPEVLNGFNAASVKRLRTWLAIAVGVWLAVLVMDWVSRFRMFRWQDRWWSKPVATLPEQAGAKTPRSWRVPAQTGAGLTQLVPVPWIASRYAEWHPDSIVHTDSWGYNNETPFGSPAYPVVVVGDSFMVSLGTQNLAQVLSAVGGIPVYNHAAPGSGPFDELQKLIRQDRFDPPPKVVVWNLSARDLGWRLFVRQPVEAWFEKVDAWSAYFQTHPEPRIRWDRLMPAELSKAWPNSSLAAFASRRTWAQIKLVVFRDWPDDVLGVEAHGWGPMLFYRWNLKALPLLTAEQDAPEVVKTVLRVARGFRARGTSLVVLLVPEKEQIYRAALPEDVRNSLAHGAAMLAGIQQALEAENVPVVNLMPRFEAETEKGRRLYWRDDTHWNDDGIRVAVEELWPVVEPLLE